ncbi:hypothetical protein GGF37_002273 [Kickxella alabastrina]|nr:hypothetical protein GGF37_002273 [Kickxella alabastrina]
MKCVRVVDPADFDNIVNAAVDESSAVFVLFFGRESPDTNLSWCPDCVIADPEVRRAVSSVENSILLEVPIDRKSDIQSPFNVFRDRADTKVERIPMLLRWTAGGPSATRLVEDDCTVNSVKEYIKSTGQQ